MTKPLKKASLLKKITLICVLLVWVVSLPVYAQIAPKANHKGKYGYANVYGEFVIAPQFDHAGNFSDEIACVKKGKKWGYINKEGALIIPFKYANAYPFSDGCAAVVVKAKNKFLFGYINAKGDEVVAPVYEHCIAQFAHERSAVKKDGKWAIINTKGEQITGFEYLGVIVSPKNKGYIMVTKEGTKNNAGEVQSGNWGIMDNDGKMITPLKYHVVRSFNDENLVLVSVDDSWGWVNMQGEEVIPLKYKQVLDFSEGLAAILENGKVNWINAKNETVLRTDYTGTTYFEDGVAYVKDRYGKWGGINTKGDIVIPLIADSYQEAHDIYLRYEKKPLTARHVKQYLLFKNRPQDKYKVKDTIPEDMWDF